MAKKTKTDTPIKFHFDFLTPGQREAWSKMTRARVTYLLGQAGTAKTFLATAYGAKAAVEWRTVEEVLLLRPTVEAAGEQLGHLPGDICRKVRPFLNPAYVIVDKLAKHDAPLRSALLSCVKTNAIAYIRGSTFENQVVVIDEAQNLNMKQMKLILSRLGPNSKIIFCGDTDQCDIHRSALAESAERLSHMDEIEVHYFGAEDNVRDPLINGMLDALAGC